MTFKNKPITTGNPPNNKSGTHPKKHGTHIEIEMDINQNQKSNAIRKVTGMFTNIVSPNKPPNRLPNNLPNMLSNINLQKMRNQSWKMRNQSLKNNRRKVNARHEEIKAIIASKYYSGLPPPLPKRQPYLQSPVTYVEFSSVKNNRPKNTKNNNSKTKKNSHLYATINNINNKNKHHSILVINLKNSEPAENDENESEV